MTGWSCNKVKSPFIHQRTWPRICIPGNIRENLLMVQWNEIFHGEPSASSHPARKDWGEDGRGNHWNSFFFFPAIFPLPSKCSASRIPQQPGKLRLSSPPSTPKLGWTHCKKFNPNPIPTSSCVQGKEGKNRNSMSLEKMHKAQTAGPPGKSNQVFISQAEEFQLFYIFRLWRTTSRHLKGTRSCPEWWQSSFKAFGIYKSKEITFWEATAAHFEQGDGERRGERSPLCSVGLSTTRPFPLSIANWGEIGKKADKCDVSGRFLNSKPQ